MKTAFLLLTLSAAATATSQQQWKVCKTHDDCNQGFYCRPTDDKAFSMCQPGDRPATGPTAAPKPTDATKPTDAPKATDAPAAGKGKQFDPCTSNESCAKGLFCKQTDKPLDGKYFSMCQPNEGCAKIYGQCGGKGFSGPSCCGNGNACKAQNEWYSQCVPASHAMASEASCTNVSVEGDATYCIEGAICGGAGDKCPKKGDVAVADCIKTLKSYADGAKCVAPVDATCQTIKTGAKGCVFGASAPAGPTQAPAATTAAPAGPTQAPAGPTQAPTSGQCAENHSQCNGQNWPFGVCCKDPNFVCNKKNDYLSLCEPKPKAMVAEVGSVAVWQQCGGNGYNGDKSCTGGNACVKINDWYSQCQPNATPVDKFPTWAQCGGLNNNFQANGKSCRDEDKCEKYNDFFSQCIPK